MRREVSTVVHACQQRTITNPDSLCRRQKPVSAQHIYCRHSCFGDSSHPASDRPIYFPVLSANVSPVASQRAGNPPTPALNIYMPATPPLPEATGTRVSMLFPLLITPLLSGSEGPSESPGRGLFLSQPCAPQSGRDRCTNVAGPEALPRPQRRPH